MDSPSYSGDGLINLMARLAQAFGSEGAGYPALDPGRDLALEEARTVVLWLIDGLGESQLARHPGAALAADRIRGMTSVFPPTTSVALTSLATGQPPRCHGVTGWFMYTHELGAVTAWLPFGPRAGKGQWGRMAPGSEALLERDALWDRFRAQVHVVQPAWLVDTPYSRATTGLHAERHGFEGLDGLLETVTAIATAPGAGRRFVYAYWPAYDGLCHEHGTTSVEADAELRAVDATWLALRERLAGSDTALLATADHGLVDTAPERVIHLDDHPELARMLALPLCGEPRAAYCYLRPGAEDDIEAYVRERLGHACRALPSERLVADGWLGPGPEHPQLRRRIGDWVLLPEPGWVIKDRLLGEDAFSQVGVHGGTASAEQRVPLIGARA